MSEARMLCPAHGVAYPPDGACWQCAGIITPARLTEMETRANAASPGPWRVVGGAGFEIYAPYDEDARQAGALDMFIADYGDADRAHPNAVFGSYARRDVPLLAAYIRRLWSEIAGLRQAHGYHTIQVDDGDGYTDEMEEPCPATDPFQRGPCICGADAHNARIDALLKGDG